MNHRRLLSWVILAALATGTPAGDIEDFVPSEKVSADDAVAFPVDI